MAACELLSPGSTSPPGKTRALGMKAAVLPLFSNSTRLLQRHTAETFFLTGRSKNLQNELLGQIVNKLKFI